MNKEDVVYSNEGNPIVTMEVTQDEKIDIMLGKLLLEAGDPCIIIRKLAEIAEKEAGRFIRFPNVGYDKHFPYEAFFANWSRASVCLREAAFYVDNSDIEDVIKKGWEIYKMDNPDSIANEKTTESEVK